MKRALLSVLGWLLLLPAAHALTQAEALAIASGSSASRVAALQRSVQHGADPRLAAFLGALLGDAVQIDGTRVEMQQGAQWVDAASGAAVTPGAAAQGVITNNYVRRALAGARAAMDLFAPDSATRLRAVRHLQLDPGAVSPQLLAAALRQEQDPAIRRRLRLLHAIGALHAAQPAQRLAAARALAASADPSVPSLLQRALHDETDAAVRAQLRASLDAVRARLAWGARLDLLFSGLSLGSILLLAALGLAVTYGLMGVINMAQGEFIMLGAYATYVTQGLFQRYAPQHVAWALAAALPAAFVVAGGVGMLVERLVIRRLYGRALETLLATWGVSLVLIQLVRSVFGPQNVQVDNPPWMSGGLQLLPNLILPYNRIVILAFTAAVLLGMWLLLARTRLGLWVRAVTQNRAMAACVGVRTARVDMLAFGLGTGIAGLAGCALSQIGNVSPEMGGGYIVDCFMVVVLGGVGQLAGSVSAAFGLGLANTVLESFAGAVLAKIAVLVAIVLFIQKRPQGLFALKGRNVEA